MNYKLNKEKKVITRDLKVELTAAEEKDIQSYVMAGYTVRYKSEKRAEAARKRAKENGFGKKKTNK